MGSSYTKGRRYAIMESDLDRDEDVLVAYYVQRWRAVKIIQMMNAFVFAICSDNHNRCTAPLFYLERIDIDKNHSKAKPRKRPAKKNRINRVNMGNGFGFSRITVN